jgi:hypothetical protein
LLLAGEENRSIFAAAYKGDEGYGVKRKVHYILGNASFEAFKSFKKQKQKKYFFCLPYSKEVVCLQPQKQRRFYLEGGVVFKVLLRSCFLKIKSKIFLKNIWRIKKKHRIFAAAYSGNKFLKVLKRNPGWVIKS